MKNKLDDFTTSSRNLPDGMVIEFENVSCSYGDKEILNKVSFQIPCNKITCIIGQSGGGKSTILKLMLGFIRPTNGQINIGGINVAELSDRQFKPIRERMGMVFQNGALFDSLTILENVEFYLEYHKNVPAKQRHELAMDLLQELGIADQLNKLPNELSGGQRKRVAIARTLIYKPDILLYDEPTTGLDPITTNMVDDLICETNHKYGITSIVVSHDIASVNNIADHILCATKGAVLTIGNPENLFDFPDPYVKSFLQAADIKEKTRGVYKGEIHA